ncbi:hypothetical protein F7725_001091 [Dissostichus mawsoni]|uniref:Monocarboxylate transporter 1 n=1 Tax=Dissostichus mawsoni TaxID=36200 RepID=A0A7J5ZGS6_DISMA|nr:hypothetical protein F7725_001091 [Dissostichus mawsoni]
MDSSGSVWPIPPLPLTLVRMRGACSVIITIPEVVQSVVYGDTPSCCCCCCCCCCWRTDVQPLSIPRTPRDSPTHSRTETHRVRPNPNTAPGIDYSQCPGPGSYSGGGAEVRSRGSRVCESEQAGAVLTSVRLLHSSSSAADMPPAPAGPVGCEPPEGGWGWAVVAGAFISIGFSYAFPKSITVFFKEIEVIFDATPSQVSWISSIMLAVMYAGGEWQMQYFSTAFVFSLYDISSFPPGPISSILVNKYGSRPIILIGGCLASTGLILASFCNTVGQLYFCIGVVGGLGLAFNLNPALTMIGKYFYKRRPIANGIAMAGSPVFLSTLAPLNTWLFDQFGWRGSFLILGGLLLNCCVAGALMRPLRPSPQKAKPDAEASE